jgi:primosomal protein N' (replication factor Y)
VLERRAERGLPPGALAFVQWAARYAVDAPGQPLAIAMRGARAPRAKPERMIAATGAAPTRATPARLRVLAAATEPMPGAALAAAAEVSSAVIKGLVDDGALEVRLIPPASAFPEPDLSRPAATLNPSQAAAAKALGDLLTQGGFQAALLDGVTGSGKTEVYLDAVAGLLKADPDARCSSCCPRSP